MKKPEPGVIEITKADYEQAIQHGILAPPPASAGRIGKLYHQAKEIFVSRFSFLYIIPLALYPNTMHVFSYPLEILLEWHQTREHE